MVTRSCLVIILLFLFAGTAKSQDIRQTSLAKRARENFDFNWQLHKGDVAMKRSIKAGGQGGLTDASSTVLYPNDWQPVNLPHDWVVENSFVNDNSMGSLPAGNGYLPTGIGFYRKEFGLPEADRGK